MKNDSLKTNDEFPKNGKIKVTNLLDDLDRNFLQIGSVIGRYKIIKEIDRGGMAVVYKAMQLDLDRIVALKVLPANITINRQFVDRFLSEAHAVAKLTHPNIVSIYEVSKEDNVYFLAMEYLPGRNLFHYMNEVKPKLVDVIEIFIQIAGALGYAHEQKIIHRDLKLNNVIMKDNKTPVLIDFGLAKAIEDEEFDDITKTGEIIGSPAYMAPERILGNQFDLRSDICSLGIMFYELLTFKNPYLDPRSFRQTTLNVIEASPIPPGKLVTWLPPEIDAITLKAMHKDPDSRYQTAFEFRDDLIHYQKGEPVSANIPSIFYKFSYFVRKNKFLLLIIAIIMFFTALFTAAIYVQNQKEQWQWKLVENIKFDLSTDLTHWSQNSNDFEISKSWNVDNGSLNIKTDRYMYIKYNRPFTRDIRFEFDVKSNDADFFEIGFFISGDQPKDGYRFVIHRGRFEKNGILLPNSNFLINTNEEAIFSHSNKYRVVVEKLNNKITFKLNGFEIAHIYDYFPPLGVHNQYVGFFVSNGNYSFDNIEIYRKTIPMLAQPTIVADRFLQHGDIENALIEYRELLSDLSDKKIVAQVKLRIAECLLRLNMLSKANTLLNNNLILYENYDNVRPNVLFLTGMLELFRKNYVKSDSLFSVLAIDYPSNHLNETAYLNILKYVINKLDQDSLSVVEDAIFLLAKRYPNNAGITGELHLQLLKRLSKDNNLNKVLSMSRRINKLYNKNANILQGSNFITAETLLGNGHKADAIELLNQCVASQFQTLYSWYSWMVLAQIYEFENNYEDAVTIYSKLSEECPAFYPFRYDAKIKLSRLSNVIKNKINNSNELLKNVINGNHTFPIPRAVAKFYLNEMSIDKLEDIFSRFSDKELFMYYDIGIRYLGEPDVFLAQKIGEIVKTLPINSWDYVRSYEIIKELDTLNNVVNQDTP